MIYIVSQMLYMSLLWQHQMSAVGSRVLSYQIIL